MYESVDQPCKICAERGLKCGAEDKLWGQRRESFRRAIPVKEKAITKVGHEPTTRKLHEPIRTSAVLPHLLNLRKLTGNTPVGAAEVLILLEGLLELYRKKSSVVGLPLQNIICYLNGISQNWTHLDQAHVTIEGIANKLLGRDQLQLAACNPFLRELTLCLENRRAVIESSRFQEL